MQGFVKDGVTEFLGIPYAAPPVGGLRWQPPQPHAPWTQTLDATKFGNTCPQITELGVFAGPVSDTEDCLYLNVFTTERGQLNGAGKYPVLLWIHGGGLVDGESNDYDAGKLARGGPSGPTVVVTINYRLGLLGYLAHPALDAEGHPFANYGLMDQQAALKWVQRNIAAFGGDPDDVTVGGQSAGSTSTAANVISPASAGLFKQAIFESGALLTVAPLDLAETRGTAFATAAGCGSDASAATADCLRGLTVQQILALQGTATANGPYVTGLIVDGTVLPVPGDTAWATGNFNHMPVMNGTVQDEGAFTASINELFFGPLTADQYESMITKTYSGPAGPGGGPPNYPAGTADKVLAQYPASAYDSPSLAYVAASTDPTACRARHLNQLVYKWVPLYAYEFQDRNAPWYFPPLSFPHGAAHTIDIQFLFPYWHGGPLGRPHRLTAEERQLSDELVGAWTNFMYSGNPNGTGDQPWPRYQGPDSGQYLSENVPSLSAFDEAEFAAAHKCGFWDSVLVY
ncbi:MAG: carboxylesterase family protein [Acetobacteraceae bacterium]|nr:carboxylesterase family protein [Acetobacteraceae bacterium]